MRHLQRRIGTLLTALVAFGLALTPTVGAADDIGDSMCALFTKKEVREALGQKHQEPSADLDAYACYWISSEFDDPQRELIVAWTDHPTTLDELKTLLADTNAPSGVVELDFGGRPAVYVGNIGLGTLYVQLDQGVLVLTMRDLQGTDWQVKLTELGALAATRGDQLVALPPGDESLMALFPTTLGGAPVATQPEYPAKRFGPDSRKDLNKRLKKQDKTFADVSMASGGPISALRIAGADASAFLKDQILSMGLASAYTVAPEKVPNGTVGVVTGPNGSVFYVYPKDDVVWGVMAEEPLLTEAFAALPGAPVPPVLPEPTPAPTPDISTPEGYLASLLPATVGGKPLTIEAYQGAEALSSDGVKLFKDVLKDQGKSIDDLVVGVAYNSTGTQIQAFRVVGGDAAPIEDVLVTQLKDTGMVDKKAKPEPVEVAGKAMRVIETAFGKGYLYPSGDVMWVVQAPDDAVLNEIFTALP